MRKKLYLFLCFFFTFHILSANSIELPDKFEAVNRYYFNFLIDIKDCQCNHLGTVICDQKPATTYSLANAEGLLIAQAILKECSISEYVDSHGAIHYSRICSFFDVIDEEGYGIGSVREYWPGKYHFLDENYEIIAIGKKTDNLWKNSIEISDLENHLIAEIHSSKYSCKVEVFDRESFDNIARQLLLIPVAFYYHNPCHPNGLNCSCSLNYLQ